MNKPKLNQPIDYLQELKRNVSIKGKLTLFQEICFEHIEKALNQPDPTIEEVKKEWKKLGYEWEEDKYFIYLKYSNKYAEAKIIIEKHTKKFWKEDGCFEILAIEFKEHQLLTKTFRALGWGVQICQQK